MKRLGVACILAACSSRAVAHDDDDGRATAKLRDDERLEHVSTRTNVEVQLLVDEPRGTPQAVVLLYPGGGGHLDLAASGIGLGADIFTVRTRREFAKSGFVAVVVDAPSDHPEWLADYRVTTDAAEDAAKVVAWAGTKWNVPVWLVGTSRSTISVANAAARKVRAHGIVLTSSVTTTPKHQVSLGDVAIEQITGPVLLVHHVRDRCAASSLEGEIVFRSRLLEATDVGWLQLGGGDSDGNASKCSALSHHGFVGQDTEVVGLIADYIRKH